jgi:hypothetical protein
VTDETLLLRQIHPNFVQNDRVTSQAFRPTPKDEGKLSVYDGDMISAEDSWKHHTGVGFGSAGVLGITVRECNAEWLVVCPSPDVFPEHAHVDFNGPGLSKAEIRGKASGFALPRWNADGNIGQPRAFKRVGTARPR